MTTTPKPSPEKPKDAYKGPDVSKLEIDQKEVERLDRLKKDFITKEKQDEKEKALTEFLKPYFQKNYLLEKKGHDYVLKARVLASDATAAEKSKVELTAVHVSKLMEEMQKDAKIAKDSTGDEAYTMDTVFMNVFNEILTDNSLVSGMLASSKFEGDITGDNLDKLAKDGKLGGNLQTLLNETRGVTDATAQKEREEALEEITEAVQAYQKEATKTQKDSGEAMAASKNGIEEWGKGVAGGLGYFLNNIGTKGLPGFVDSTPKIASLLAFGASLFIFSGTKGAVPTLIMWLTGLNFAWQNVSLNGDIVKDSFGTMGGWFSALFKDWLKPAEAAEDDTDENAASSSKDKETKTASSPEFAGHRAAINSLSLRDMPPAGLAVLKQSFTASTGDVLKAIEGVPVHGNVYQFDIKVNDISSLLDEQGKKALENGEIKKEQVAAGYNNLLEGIGKIWRPVLERSMGREFTKARSDAYLAWFIMKFKIFDWNAQGTVLQEAKKYINPNTSFALATYLMLDRRHGEANKNDQLGHDLAVAREQVGLRVASLKTLREEFRQYEEKLVGAPASSPNSGTGSSTEAPQTAAAEKPMTDLEREGATRDAEKAVLEAIKQDGYYTEAQIRELLIVKKTVNGVEQDDDTFYRKAEQIIGAKTEEIITLLQKDKIQTAADSLKSMIGQLNAGKFLFGNLRNLDNNRALNTFYVRLHESHQLDGYRDRIGQLREKVGKV